jgi:hypothetical protein
MEVLVATILLVTALVAVAQLVPVAVTSNNGSRRDSTATVVAQRQLSLLMEQSLTNSATVADPFGTGTQCGVGDPAQPGVTVGSPVVLISNSPAINFSAAKVPNYNLTFKDPQDPYQATFDIRWAVITSGNGTTASSRRFILGARQTNAQNYVLPLTLDAMVQR